VRCDLDGGITLKGKVINLGTDGTFIRTDQSLKVGASVTLEFLLPGTLTSIKLTGETMWARSYEETEDGVEEEFHVAGVRFHDQTESFRSLIRDYIFKMLDNDELVRSQGIFQVLDDIRNLPSLERLEAYRRLIKKSSDSVLK
jgi:hypothetical protein